MKESADEDAAARWAVRLDGEPLDVKEQQALDLWLAAGERRVGILLRAEAALAYLDRARALAVSSTHRAERFVPMSVNRRVVLAGGAIGSIAASGLAGFLLLRDRPLEIRTAIGEGRRVPLADGSVASVNTDSSVAVAMLGRRRQVKLEDGEAWFQVVHDKTRPFVVAAGPVRIQAIGTAFAVRRRDAGADVLVTEGVVETWVVGHEQRRTRIAAGSRAFVANVEAPVVIAASIEDIDRELAWRTGELALDGENLAYAVAELNRYNSRKIAIEDEELGREPLVGYFRTDQPDVFGRAVAKVVGARVEENGDSIVLRR